MAKRQQHWWMTIFGESNMNEETGYGANGLKLKRKHLPTILFSLLATMAGLFSFAQAEDVVTLERCVEMALTQGQRAAAAAARVEAAAAAGGEARSVWYPRVYLSGSYALTDNPPQAFMMSLNQRALNMADPAFNPNEPDVTDNIRWTAGIQYRLLDPSRGAMLEMVRQGHVAAQSQEQAVRNELAHRVTERYYGALMAKAFVSVREESLKSLEESLRVAGERLKAGAAVRTDVLSLEVKQAEAQESLIRARNGLELALASLNAVIGGGVTVTAGKLQDVVEPAELPRPEKVDDSGATGRPELTAFGAAVRAGAAAEKRAARDRMPVVGAFGTMDFDGGDGSSYERSYMAGVMIEWDLFDGFRRSSAVARLKAERKAMEQDMAGVEADLRLDLRQAQLQAEEAWQRLAVARKSLESAQEAFRMTRERYQQGAADVAELVMAQAGLTSIRMSRAASYYEYLTAMSNVQRTLGLRAAAFPSIRGGMGGKDKE